MLGTRRLFDDLRGALVERLRLGVAREPAVHLRKVVERHRNIGIVRAVDLLINLEHTAVQLIRLRIEAERLVG